MGDPVGWLDALRTLRVRESVDMPGRRGVRPLDDAEINAMETVVQGALNVR